MDVKPIQWWWFSGATGIVLVDVEGERKLYIGTGQGRSEQEDVQHICDWGSTLHASRLTEILDAYNAK